METEKPVASFWYRLLVAALTIAGATLVLLASQTAGGLLTNILPATAAKLNLSLSDVSVLAYIRHFAFIAGAVLAGFFGGRPGWRKTALAGLVVMSLSIGLSGAVAGFAGLAAVHLFAGLGGGLLLTALIVILLADVGSRRLLASAAALYFAMKLLGTLASVFGFVLVQQFGLRNVFMIAGGASLGIGLAGMGLILLALAARRGRIWREEWLDEGRTGVHPTGLTLVLAAAFLVAWAGLSTGWVSLFATKELGMKAAEIGLIYSASGAASLFAALASFLAGGTADLADWLTGRFLRRRFGRLVLFGLGILVLCSGLGILLAAREAKALTAALIAINLGLAVLAPPLLAMVVSRAPARMWGAAVGLFLAADALGNLGGVVNGAAAKVWGVGSLAVIGIAVSLAALALALVALKYEKPDPATAAETEMANPSPENTPN